MHRTVCAIQCPATTRTGVRRFGHIPSSRCQANRCLEQRNRVSSTLDVVSRSTFDGAGSGGARRDRTEDLLLAKQALSQLRYGPVQGSGTRGEGSHRLPKRNLPAHRWILIPEPWYPTPENGGPGKI